MQTRTTIPHQQTFSKFLSFRCTLPLCYPAIYFKYGSCLYFPPAQVIKQYLLWKALSFERNTNCLLKKCAYLNRPSRQLPILSPVQSETEKNLAVPFLLVFLEMGGGLAMLSGCTQTPGLERSFHLSLLRICDYKCAPLHQDLAFLLSQVGQ